MNWHFLLMGKKMRRTILTLRMKAVLKMTLLRMKISNMTSFMMTSLARMKELSWEKKLKTLLRILRLNLNCDKQLPMYFHTKYYFCSISWKIYSNPYHMMQCLFEYYCGFVHLNNAEITCKSINGHIVFILVTLICIDFWRAQVENNLW